MEQTEYTLSIDEQGMVKPLIDNIETLQKECQTILRAITRLRGLDGNWNLIGDKLVRMNQPALLPMPKPEPVTQPNGLAHREG